MRTLLNAFAAPAVVLAAAGVSAQSPPPAAPAQASAGPVGLLQNDLILKAGSDRIFFSGNDYAVSPAARATLMAQARWLLANPSVQAIVEGHGDERDTRDHALAIGERRAAAVRNYLVALGVPAARLGTASWGKERPVVALPGVPASGVSARVVLVIVR